MRSKPEKRGTVDANMVFEMMKNAIVNCVKGCLRRVMFNKNFVFILFHSLHQPSSRSNPCVNSLNLGNSFVALKLINAVWPSQNTFHVCCFELHLKWYSPKKMQRFPQIWSHYRKFHLTAFWEELLKSYQYYPQRMPISSSPLLYDRATVNEALLLILNRSLFCISPLCGLAEWSGRPRAGNDIRVLGNPQDQVHVLLLGPDGAGGYL